jgi:hypothetical protein
VLKNIEIAQRWLETACRDDVETCAQLVAENYAYTDHTKSNAAGDTDRVADHVAFTNVSTTVVHRTAPRAPAIRS